MQTEPYLAFGLLQVAGERVALVGEGGELPSERVHVPVRSRVGAL
jgi:hypothetical protein